MVFDGAKWIGAAVRAGADSSAKSAKSAKSVESAKPAKNEDAPRPALYFRRDFAVGKGLTKAVLYATAVGLYEAYVNDFFAGDELFAPGFATAGGRIAYQEYDVTEKLHRGKNVLGAVVAEMDCDSACWDTRESACEDACEGSCEGGKRRGARLLMKLVLEYKGGAVCEIVSDSCFRTTCGRILSCDFERGEVVDNRLPESYEMFAPGMNAEEWENAAEYGDDFSALFPQEDEPVRFLHRLKGMPAGRDRGRIYDFGQNSAGVPYLTVRADEGTKLTLRYAEALKDGALCFADKRSAECRDVFYCRRGRQILTPSFTYHGCRYAEAVAEDGEAKIEDFFFNVCHSDLARTGMFDCSDELVNRLYTNALWSQRSCFVSVPTRSPSVGRRCPDALCARLFCGSAMYNADCRRFYASCLDRLREEEAAGCAVCEIAYRHYLVYGDSGVLRDNIEAMTAWVDAQKARGASLVLPADGEGDRGETGAETDSGVVATALFARSAFLTAKCRDILGLESAEYHALFEDIKAAFNRAFADGMGRLKSDTQTCYLLALAYGLCEDGAECFRHLLRTLELGGGRPTTGELGTSLLLPVLCKYGREDLAYGLLLSTEYPSLGWQVGRGATTVWESRGGNGCVCREGGAESGGEGGDTNGEGVGEGGDTNGEGVGEGGEGGSLNGCGFASFAEWLYSHMLGIRPDREEPGFKSLVIKPVTDPKHRVKAASGCYAGNCGRVDVEWTDEDGIVTLKVYKEASAKARLDISGEVLSVEANGEAATLSLIAGAEEICVKYRPRHSGIEI